MKYNFEIDKFDLVNENSNSQFATVEVDVCRSGNNSHRLFISRDCIKCSASSIKAKPILASFNITNTDFQGHNADEVPIGFFEDEEPELVEKDNELYIRAKGRIWKRYFSNAMDIFSSKDGKTEVSMEIEMLEGEDATAFSDGHIDAMSLTGVTLLGVAPSIKGSEARVLSFSELQNEYNKEQDTLTELQQFVAKKKENFKVEKLYNKLNLNNEEGEKENMEEKKEFEVEEEETLQVFEEKSPEEDSHATDEEDKEEVEHDDEKAEEDFAEDEKQGEEEKESEEDFEAEPEKEEVEEKSEEEFEKEPDEEEEKEEEPQKEEMSLDVHDDMAGYLAMLENETDEYKELGKKVLDEQDKGLVMQEVIKMAKELNELKQFKQDIINKEKDFQVNQILAEVKGDISEEQFAELTTEGAEICIENLTMFANKARAMAYANSKKQDENTEEKEFTFARMGFAFNDGINVVTNVNDIYNKY